MSNYTQVRKTTEGADSVDTVLTRPNSRLLARNSGEYGSYPLHEAYTNFNLLPAGTVVVGSDLLMLLVGVGTEIAARAAGGGVNLKTQVTTPADGDDVYIKAVAASAMIALLRANAQHVFETRVAIGSTAFATMFASFGLNENPTDSDPGGTAGEGAMFLFAPLGPGTAELTVDTGLTLAQHANWILAHKVNGVDTFTATSIKVVAGQSYDLRIEIGVDLKAKFYIDDVYVGIGPVLTAGDSVSAFAGVELTGTPAGQADADVRYIRLGRNID